MQIIFKRDDKSVFLKAWKEYLDSNVASFRFLPEYLDYNVNYSSLMSEDKSFVAIENGKCVAICFLPVEKVDGHLQISLANAFTVAPLCSCERVDKFVHEQIDAIAEKLGVDKIMLYLDPLTMKYKKPFNTLLQHGFIDCSSSDGIVDLRIPHERLWGNLNKSYRPLINGIKKDATFSIDVFDAANASYEAHEQYRQLHKLCAGRETRCKKTFDVQFDLVKDGKGVFIGLKRNGAYVCFNYFFHFQKTAIYYSGADDPAYDHSGIAIYHPVLWSAIDYYSRKGFDFLEFSEPCAYAEVGGFKAYADAKQLAISRFKRCMGAEMVCFHRGVKYFDEGLLLADIEGFKQKAVADLIRRKQARLETKSRQEP